MRAGRPKRPLDLTVEERETLQRWTRRRKSAQALALRARIVLGCDQGQTNQAVARRLSVTPQTVGKWRERFRVGRLEALADEPRPGAPRKISDAQVEDVIVRTLESTPKGATPCRPRRFGVGRSRRSAPIGPRRRRKPRSFLPDRPGRGERRRL